MHTWHSVKLKRLCSICSATTRIRIEFLFTVQMLLMLLTGSTNFYQKSSQDAVTEANLTY